MRALVLDVDERLLIEAAQRDPLQFAALYDAHIDRVFAYVARRVPTRHEAEDVTAEVFQQALANIGRYEHRGVPFIAWLYRIAANAIADRWQREARTPAQFEVDGEEPAADQGIERRAMLAQMLDSLPPDQRLVLQRRFFEDRAIRDIAQELGRSEGAVKQLQFRALHNLRARLGKMQ